MKKKKTGVVLLIVLLVLCFLAIGGCFLTVGLQGNLEQLFSLDILEWIVPCFTFSGGTIGIVLGVAIYAIFIYVVVMFVVSVVKKRGAYFWLDLLSLILAIWTIYLFAYMAEVLSTTKNGAILALIAVLALFCIVFPIFPLLLGPADSEQDHGATHLSPLPSSIPTVDKKDSDEGEPVEEKKAEKDQNASKKETPVEESPAEKEPEPIEEAIEEKPAEEKIPVEAKEEAQEAPLDEKPAEEEKEEPKSSPSPEKHVEADDKMNKTEEKPMKAEKKPTKAVAKTPAAKPAAKAAPKAAAKPAAKAPAASKSQKAQGKYEVYPEAGFFKYRLKANNGEILIVSNGYKTRDGAHKGIETLVKAVASGVAKIVVDKKGYGQFRLFTANDSRLIVSGEFYPNAAAAQSALNSVEKFYKTDKIVDLEEISEDEVREWRISLPKAEKSDKGKFEIYIDEGKKFRGRLLANNGQLLFATSAYTSKAGVNGALEKVQKKFDSQDVTITCDKQGRYQFVVYADNGAVLVMGESYSSKDRAFSAAKSSKNFATNPQIIDVTKAEE